MSEEKDRKTYGKTERKSIFWIRFSFSWKPLDFYECSHSLVSASSSQKPFSFLAACSQGMSYTFSDPLLGSTKRVQLQVPLLPHQRSPIFQQIPWRCSTILKWQISLSSYCGVWKHDEPYGKRYLSEQCFNKNKGEKYKSLPHLEWLIIAPYSSGQGD